ncbi:hypothetical protein [Winogradskyella aurantiaca]|uniref:hypothetical protein n=1 Tax=Winogradskyella aurantiaca TaxID=2219558 RepID=UPI000E1C5842|nr:hypothetical protein [Winogradskyella aurantiaca]
MKAIILSVLAVFLLTNQSMFASELKSEEYVNYGSLFYNNSIVFVENQIEFAVFPDGQFDFSFPGYGTNVTLGLSVNNFSFNAGFNYNPYIQYDAFGAAIQIENTPVYYDDFGRVIQIGTIGIQYNRFGHLVGVGGLNVVFNNNVIVNFSGYINPYNRFYVYRPWHRYYAIPAVNYCVVYARPYRAFYNPIRHVYYRPYVNNYRYSVVASRRAYARNGHIRKGYTNRYRQEARNSRDRQVAENYNRRYSSRSSSSRVAQSERTRSYVQTTDRNPNASSNNRNLRSNKERNRTLRDNRVSTNYKTNKSNRANGRKGSDLRSKKSISKVDNRSNSRTKNSRVSVTPKRYDSRSKSIKTKSKSRSSNKSRGLTKTKTSERRSSRSPN